MHRVPRASSAAVAVAVVGVLLTGCGSASAPYEPTGVDELTIPTPDPDPADFVEVVDNPWLPAVPGTRWEYDDLTTIEAVAGVERDGIATTDLVRIDRASSDSARNEVVDHVAQDRAGNVWWFGRNGTWFAEPGLLMPAAPRHGDGFVMVDGSGLDVRAEVRSTDESATVLGETRERVVLVEVFEGGATTPRREYYAEGVGLVSVIDAQGRETGLVEIDQPRS